MNENISQFLAGLLAIGLVIVGIFAFNQNSQLSDTQSALTEAESAGTVVADSLNQANDNAIQFAQDVAETSTQSSINFNDAVASNTQASIELADSVATNAQVAMNLVDANATATQSADEAIVIQESISLTATTVAENVDTMQSTADAVGELATQSVQTAMSVQDANSTQLADASMMADGQATQIADAEATVVGLQDEIVVLNAFATQVVDLNDTIATLEAATVEPTLEGKPAGDADGSDISNDENIGSEAFIEVEASDFSLLMPNDFLFFDLRTDQDEAIDTINSLGVEYVGAASIAGQGPPLYLAIAVHDEPNSDGTVDNFNLTTEVLPVSLTMEDYLAQAVQFLPADFEVISQEIIEISGEEVGRLRLDATFFSVDLQQLAYVYIIDDTVYFLIYTTTVLDDDILALFEKSLSTFALQ